jgi:hypothetical protein
MDDKYSKCPYFTPGSYVTKPYECNYCGNVAPFKEKSIKARAEDGKVVFYSWCKPCTRRIPIDRIPTMIEERLYRTVGSYDFVHMCNNINLHTSADMLKKCSSHKGCWTYLCQKCNSVQHVKTFQLIKEVTERLEKAELQSKTQNVKSQEKSVFGVDIAY